MSQAIVAAALYGAQLQGVDRLVSVSPAAQVIRLVARGKVRFVFCVRRRPSLIHPRSPCTDATTGCELICVQVGCATATAVYDMVGSALMAGLCPMARLIWINHALLSTCHGCPLPLLPLALLGRSPSMEILHAWGPKIICVPLQRPRPFPRYTKS